MKLKVLALATFVLSSASALADIKVVASIKPIHSLVAAVMEGVGAPTLMIDGNNSPHTYSLKPSDAQLLQDAQIIFWIGHEYEAFLEKPIESLGSRATSVSLIDTVDLKKLPVRKDPKFSPEKEPHDDHHHEGIDSHIWLDPENAKVMLVKIAKILSEADPEHATRFTTNAVKTSQHIDELSNEITAQVPPLKGGSFIVFHDAYQYFENRFDVHAAGALSISPENVPGAATIAELKNQISQGHVTCVFAEPQFDEKLVDLLLENSTAKKSMLDPLGVNIEAGPSHYFTLLRHIASSLNACLSPS